MLDAVFDHGRKDLDDATGWQMQMKFHQNPGCLQILPVKAIRLGVSH